MIKSLTFQPNNWNNKAKAIETLDLVKVLKVPLAIGVMMSDPHN